MGPSVVPFLWNALQFLPAFPHSLIPLNNFFFIFLSTIYDCSLQEGLVSATLLLLSWNLLEDYGTLLGLIQNEYLLAFRNVAFLVDSWPSKIEILVFNLFFLWVWLNEILKHPISEVVDAIFYVSYVEKATFVIWEATKALLTTLAGCFRNNMERFHGI